MGLAEPKRLYSPEEYLRLEYDATEKHQYYQGEIFAMAGGSPQHSLIIANVIREVGNALRGRPCRVYDSNLRVRVPRTTLYTYPDASVICGERQFDPLDRQRQTVLNPTLIVEALPGATEGYDRGAEFESYRQIESLQEYLLLSQDVARAETFLRQADGRWLYSAATGPEATLRLGSVEMTLKLADVYEGVELVPAAPPAEPDAGVASA